MNVKEWFKLNKEMIAFKLNNGYCDIRGCYGHPSGILSKDNKYRLVCSEHYCKGTYKETVGTVGVCRYCKDVALQVLMGRCDKHR